MKRSKYSMVVFALCFISSSVIFADDGYFGGIGDIVFPSTGTKIRMVSETVHLKYRPGNYGMVYAECDFEFVNPGDDTEITMGFPAEPRENYDDEFMPPDSSPTLIRDFTVFIDGKKSSCVLKKITNKERIKELNFEDAFLWKVKMPRNKIVRLHHTYNYYVSGDNGGTVMITYILNTGALWNGRMDKAEIELDLGRGVTANGLEVRPSNYKFKKGVIRWTYKNFKPTEDIRVVFR